jgi:hypothetical protein
VVLGIVIIGVLLWVKTRNQGTSQIVTLTLPATQTFTPSPLLTSTPSIASTLTPTPTTTTTPNPSWVTNFSDPILAAIKNREPDFQDDFSTDTKRWYSVSIGDGFDFDTTLVIKDGVMRLEEAYGISNYYFLNKPNIVLQVDVLHPISCCVSVNASHYFRECCKMDDYLNLSSNTDWDAKSSTYSAAGKYNYNEQRTQVIMIVEGSQVAYYINGLPVAYFDDPRLLVDKNNIRYFVCSVCELDNVKVWNLANIVDRP